MKTRRNQTTNTRKKGEFSRRCQCILHSKTKSRLLNLHQQKEIQQSIIKNLVQRKLIPRGDRGSVCWDCAQTFSQSSSSSNEHREESGSGTSNANVPESSLAMLQSFQAENTEQIFKEIEEDVTALYNSRTGGTPGNIKDLIEYEPVAWLKQRHRAVVELFSRLC